MSIRNVTRTGFTKTGFTRSGFACCGHFKICEMGKASCFYEETDPEAKMYCAAYQRNHAIQQLKAVQEEVAATEQIQEDAPLSETEEGQLSLF